MFKPNENQSSLSPAIKPQTPETTGKSVGGVVGKEMGPGLAAPMKSMPTAVEPGFFPPGGTSQNRTSLASARPQPDTVPPARAVSAGPTMGPGLLPASGSLRSTPTRPLPGDANATGSLKMPRTKGGSK